MTEGRILGCLKRFSHFLDSIVRFFLATQFALVCNLP
jgi:hypothetical protein